MSVAVMPSSDFAQWLAAWRVEYGVESWILQVQKGILQVRRTGATICFARARTCGSTISASAHFTAAAKAIGAFVEVTFRSYRNNDTQKKLFLVRVTRCR